MNDKSPWSLNPTREELCLPAVKRYDVDGHHFDSVAGQFVEHDDHMAVVAALETRIKVLEDVRDYWMARAEHYRDASIPDTGWRQGEIR